MIKLIICDIGGVIEYFTERMYVDYICDRLGIDKKAFTTAFMPMLQDAEVGKGRTADMLKVLGKRFSVSPRALKFSSSIATLAKLDNDLVGLLNALHKNYKVVLLTNVSRSRYLQNEKIGLFRKIKHDRVFASCYLRMKKPDGKIYRYVLRKMRCKPQEAIFIDDIEANVKGALAVGILGIQFKNYDKLARDLKLSGIRW